MTFSDLLLVLLVVEMPERERKDQREGRLGFVEDAVEPERLREKRGWVAMGS